MCFNECYEWSMGERSLSECACSRVCSSVCVCASTFFVEWGWGQEAWEGACAGVGHCSCYHNYVYEYPIIIFNSSEVFMVKCSF